MPKRQALVFVDPATAQPRPLTWTAVDVTVEYTEPLLGTVPRDPDVYARYLAPRAPDTERGAEEIATVEAAPEDEPLGPAWTGFHRDEEGYFVYDYFVAGHLRESALELKDALQIPALRSYVEQYLVITPRRLRFQWPPGFHPDPELPHLERSLRARTRQGPRITIVRSDYVPAGTRLHFRLHLLTNAHFSWDVVRTLFTGQWRGMGQWRNGGWGRYDVVGWEPVTGEGVVPDRRR